MGLIASRRNAGVEEIDVPANNAYRYPPKSGNYFANHFIMGGERFDTIQPEMYLFGENQDLNFLGNRPMPFPYPLNHTNDPSRTLKSLVNIRKDSLRFVKVQDAEADPKSDKAKSMKDDSRYNIEFTFDSDVPCAITIYFFATEEFTNGHLVYHPRDPSLNSDTFHYKRGANQTFSQTSHVIDPSKFPDDDWLYHGDKDLLPVVVHCVVEDAEHRTHSHATFGVVEYNADSSYTLKPLKQKQAVDGLCYLIQEIYGIENKNNERSKMDHEDEFEDNASECVICMCEMRDTLILPCRHLCLCSCCANNLRYQANNCPICRAPFRALLQIRTLRKKLAYQTYVQNEEDIPPTHDGIPQGYESTSLMEALNGPLHPLPQNPLHMPPDGLPPPVRPSLLNSPSSSPEVGKQRKLVKPHQSISDMSLRDAAVSVPDPGESSDTEEKMLGQCVLLQTPEHSSSSPSETTSSSDRTDLKAACSDRSISVASDETRSESLSASVPSVEIVNEMNNARKLGRSALSDSNKRIHDITGSPRYRRPRSDLGLTYVSENDETTSLDYPLPAAHSAVMYSKPTDLDGRPGDEDCAELALPGTPSNNDGSSGSSYGSTSSTKMLLQDPVRSDCDASPVNGSSGSA